MTERAQPSTVGLLCGAGDLPLQAARALRERGCRVVAVALKGEADPAVEEIADEVHWTGLAKLGRWLRVFRRAEVDTMLMLGGVRKERMYENKLSLLPDWQSVKLWYRKLTSKEDHTILEAVADEFENAGIPVSSIVDICPELLVREGCLTRREPTEAQWRDIRFAWPIAKQIAALQIGQCVVVKEEAVIAVEGIDGTDATLRRGGRLAGGGAVAVKVAKQGHDERFDIPCIGPETVEVLEESGVAVLAMEAGRTILLNPDEVAAKADRARLCIVATALEDEGAGA
ncbi:MAG: UDP-2,3-diacylglucosamine diphosphatase LpxI [Candidatus Brocadiia bacterium]